MTHLPLRGALAPLTLSTRAPSSILGSLVAYWNLDEVSGSRADSVGGQTLTDNATVTQAAGKVNFAGQFTAANTEFLSRNSEATLQTGDIDFTFAGWAYLDTKAANMQMLSKRGSNAAIEYDLSYDVASNRFIWRVGSGAGTVIGTATANVLGSPSTATWYYIVVWHDAANNLVGIQVNDGTANTAATTGPAGTGTVGFKIGAKNTSPIEPWNGRIDEVGLWKRLLTSAEKTALYGAGNGLAYPFS